MFADTDPALRELEDVLHQMLSCFDTVITYGEVFRPVIRTQISVDEEMYARAKKAARRQGISLAELCRRSLAETLAREPVCHPWMAWVGSLEGRPEDSASVDDVVYGREAP